MLRAPFVHFLSLPWKPHYNHHMTKMTLFDSLSPKTRLFVAWVTCHWFQMMLLKSVCVELFLFDLRHQVHHFPFPAWTTCAQKMAPFFTQTCATQIQSATPKDLCFWMRKRSGSWRCMVSASGVLLWSSPRWRRPRQLPNKRLQTLELRVGFAPFVVLL